MINVFLTNLGMYNEGTLVGEWVTLPCSEEAIAQAMDRIGINEEYEEYFITDWESEVSGLEISEYSNIYDLNEMAEELESCGNFEVVEALMECYGYELEEALDKADHVIYEVLDRNFFGSDELNLAYTVIETFGGISEAVHDMSLYFDYDQFGMELRWDLPYILDEEEESDLFEELESMTDAELAEWYLDGFGDVSELGEDTLERYFDYEAFGRDLMFDYSIASNGIALLDC